MSNPDPRPTSSEGAHTVYGRRPPSSRRGRWIWIVLGVIAFAIVLFFIYQATTPPAAGAYGGAGGRSGRRGGAGGAGGPPTSVNAALAARGEMPIFLDELGTATPTATVTVVPQIAGVLQTVAFKEGQMVRKGQFLAQIDPRPYQAALLQAQGAVTKDRAALAEARLDLKRYQTLLTQNSIGSQQVDVQAATVIQDEGQVTSDEAAVVSQKLNLIYCRITSPVDGRVGLRQVDPGNYITAGASTGIVVITVLAPMDVLFTVPEDNLAAVAKRLKSGAVLKSLAFDRAQSVQLASGALLTLDNQVDTTTGTVRAKARFNNADGALFPNQFVNIRLTVDTLKNAVIVPTSAILKGPDGMFVYTVAKTRTVKVTPVKVGPAAGENTSVVSGLDGGEVVVTDGSDRLKDGGRVILPGDCIPSRGGASGGRGPAGPGAPGGPAPSSGGFFGLFAKKSAVDPMASMRCKPGEKPHSLLTSAHTVPTVNASSDAPSAPTGGQGAAPGGAGAASPTSRGPALGGPAATAAPSSGAPAPAEAAGGGDGPSGRMRAMLAPLNLDPQQQEKARAIFAAAREDAENTGDFRAAFQTAFGKLDAILRPDQKAKLAQERAEAAARRSGGGGGPSDQ